MNTLFNSHHDYVVMINLLREIRRKAGITQVELARRLGVDQPVVSKVERLERRLDISELRQVCLALGISLIDVVTHFEATIAKLPLETNNAERNPI